MEVDGAHTDSYIEEDLRRLFGIDLNSETFFAIESRMGKGYYCFVVGCVRYIFFWVGSIY